MRPWTLKSIVLASVTIHTLFTGCVDGRQQTQRREVKPQVNPVVQMGWTLPLEGGQTCIEPKQCSNTLPAPSSSSQLQYLAIGRGTITYSCEGRKATQGPIYTTQKAFLYDTTSLVSKFSTEEQFHSYIPRFLDYDYTSLVNSTLKCIGNVQRTEGLTVFDIYHIDAFIVKVKDVVTSPNNPPFDVQWSHSQDNDQEWDVYRVETAGGGPPYNCGDQIVSDEIPVEYAAEYWFYRRNING